MQPLRINNGLCVVCNDKRQRPYASTCKRCYYEQLSDWKKRQLKLQEQIRRKGEQ